MEALKRMLQDAASIAPEASSPIDFRNFNNAHFRSDSPFSFRPLLAHLFAFLRPPNAWKEHTHTRAHTERKRERIVSPAGENEQAAISRHCSQYAGVAEDLKRENSALPTRENLAFFWIPRTWAVRCFINFCARTYIGFSNVLTNVIWKHNILEYKYRVFYHFPLPFRF